MKLILSLNVFFGAFHLVYNYKILAVLPLSGPSHFRFQQSILVALVERGHEVDVISPYERKDPLRGYNDLTIKGSHEVDNALLTDKMQGKGADAIFQNFAVPTCQALFESDAAKRLKNSTKKYDLLITEIFSPECSLIYSHLLKIPIVSTVTSVMLPWGNDRIGNPDNPSYIPNYFQSSTGRMSLVERLINTVSVGLYKYKFEYMSIEPSNALVRKYFGDDIPDLRELVKETSLILVNSHFSLNSARPTVPNFIEIAGIHIQDVKPLPSYLENVLNDTRGVIYFSLGSMLQTESIPKKKLQGLFDAFSELPHKVLFKTKKEGLPKGLIVPKNVHFEKWLPQLDLLCHPNVALFITHGGLLSTQEAIYCGVPMIGIPIFADQYYNVKQLEANGIGILVDYSIVTKESVLKAAKTILTDLKYKEHSAKVSSLFKDRPLSPKDTAVYWIEYVIRHKGAPQLRSVGADLPWYQYYLTDVFCILIFVSIVFLYVIYLIAKVILRTIFKKSRSLPKAKAS